MAMDWKSVLLLCLVSTSGLTAIMACLKAFERRANTFLLALIVAWALLATPLIIGFSGAYQAFPGLTFAPFNTEFWMGPLWFAYIKTLTHGRVSRHDYYWFIPGIIQTLYYSCCFFFLGAPEAKFIYNANVHGPIIAPLETLLGLSLSAVTLFLSWQTMKAYKAWLPSAHGNTRLYELVWLERLLWAVLGLFGLWVLTDIWQEMFTHFTYFQTFWLFVVSGTALTYIACEALSKSHLRFPKITFVERTVTLVDASSKVIEPLDLIRQKIKTEGWHRDPDLSLSKLARKLAVSPSSLSRRINAAPGQNFNRLINAIRIAEICEILSTADTRQNLLNLALDTGFGSKATFNRAFKAETGQSPREWLQVLKATG